MSTTLIPALYVVSTPIGNLGDITVRALDVLRGVDQIYAEDTRVTAKLLGRYDIKAKMRSCREAMPREAFSKVAGEVVETISNGGSVAYVSDAGTPGISDPGNALVAEVVKAGHSAIPIPGASALTTLLSVSGLPLKQPMFVGFLPKKKGHQTLLNQLFRALQQRICDGVVIYESPERLIKLLEEWHAYSGPLTFVIGRELTKAYEEITRGSLEDCLAVYAGRQRVKGEIVLIVSNLLTPSITG